MSYSRGNRPMRRDDRRNDHREAPVVSPWESGRFGGAFNNGSVGLGGSPVNQLALLGSLLGGGNPTGLASSLALAQVLQGQSSGLSNMSTGGFSGNASRERDSNIRSRLGRASSPIRSRGFRRSRSRSRDRGRGNGRDDRNRQGKRQRSPNGPRPEHEIYVGNYPVRYREGDLRKLFEENNVKILGIRMKNDGNKVFAFVETENLGEIEKAVKALDSKEIAGRRLRVRSAKDKGLSKKTPVTPTPKPKPPVIKKKRELREEDITNHLAFAICSFIDRQLALPATSDDAKSLLEIAKEAVSKAFALPEGDSLKVTRRLESIFFDSTRREIKLPDPVEEPEKPEPKPKVVEENQPEDDKTIDDDLDDEHINQNIEFEEDDDSGNWKRRKTDKSDEEEDTNQENELALSMEGVEVVQVDTTEETKETDDQDVAKPLEDDNNVEAEEGDEPENIESESGTSGRGRGGRGTGGRARRSRGRRT